MSSVFETAGFTPYKTPQTVQPQQASKTPEQTSNAAAPSAPPVQTVQHSSDTFTSTETVNRNDLKEELRKEILEEIKKENQAEKNKEKKEDKPGFIKGLKRFIGNVGKVFVTAGEYIKGLLKGVVKGGITGGALFGTLYGFGKSKLFDNTKLLQKPIMHKLLKGKYTAPIVGGAALAIGVIGNLWNASVKANEKRALIEHKWEKTPVIR